MGGIIVAWPWVRDSAFAIPDPAAAGSAALGADARLIIWILAWDVHALLTQPLRLFEANIFHPAPGMLAGSEHLLGSVPLFAPAYLLSGNPALAANVAALATYPLAAVTMYVLVRRLGLAPAAAAVAGAALPFSVLRVPGDLHLLQYPNYVLALLVLALVAAGERPRGTRLVWLNAAMLLALLSSFYVAAMAVVVVAIELAIVAATVRVATAARLGLALAPALAIVTLVSLPYLRLAGSLPAPPSFDLAMIGDVARLAEPQIRARAGEMGGWAVPWLALLGVCSPLLLGRAPTVRWWRWLLLTLIGAILGAGPAVWVADHVVPLPGALVLLTPLRAHAASLRFFMSPRFFVLAGVGVVGMAAEGTALVLAAAANLGAGRVLCGALAALLLAGAALPAALHVVDQPRTRLPVGTGVPQYYRWLATAPHEPLLEIPAAGSTPGSMLVQSDIMYLSTFHWLPLVNGHTGLRPWWFLSVANEAAALPDPAALQAIVDLTGVRWILVRRDRVPPSVFERWEAAASDARGLSRVPVVGPALLLKVELPARRAWSRALARGKPAPGETSTGTPLIPLVATAAHGLLTCPQPPASAIAGNSITLHLVARNDGDADWPAMLPPWLTDTHLVVVEASWSDADGAPVREPAVMRLPRDVASADRVAWDAPVAVPERPGVYTLDLRLRQPAGEAFATSPPLRLPVRIGPR